jgi:Fe(3+) dicitrate transport protein
MHLLRRSPLALALAFALTQTAQAETPDTADAHKKESTLATVEVIGSAEKLEQLPGSGAIISQEELTSSRALTVNEALRKVPGIHVRDEEGFGLRPNIGIRGLNPTRSTKVLLLEDGIPAAYAPYSDNASYYHAPIQRYDRIEVLKGAGMLRFGPQTIGGAINYITPEPPEEFGGYVQASAGSRNFSSVQASLGGNGLLVDFSHKQGDGARDNNHLSQSDLFAKYVLTLNDEHALTFRANVLEENSDIGYTGITDAELGQFGREYNPFDNDRFDIRHHALSVTHKWQISEGNALTTSAYFADFLRDWWRQSSTTTDTQCGNAFRDDRFNGVVVDPDACNSTQGRLRAFYTRGVESRLSVQHGLLGADNTFDVGLRLHGEVQERLQVNAASANGRSGTVAEDNRREADALAAYMSNTFRWGDFSLVPSLRHERIDYFRRNKLTGLEGEEQTSETIAGIGLNHSFSPAATLFAGVHEGFAPPRAEDIINNSGGSVEVDAEHSVNSELGLRGRVLGQVDYEVALFQNDFSNQIAVGSIAGGSTPLAQGETLYRGAELALSWNRQALQSREGEWYANLALTLLPTARQESPLTAVVGGAVIGGSAVGKRLPYAPERTATLRMGYVRGAWDASVEVQSVSAQFADFANTVAPVANGNGQIGRVGGYAVWGATINYEPGLSGFSGFLTVKNLGDLEYIVDRTRGILLGNPLQVIAGVRYTF